MKIEKIKKKAKDIDIIDNAEKQYTVRAMLNDLSKWKNFLLLTEDQNELV